MRDLPGRTEPPEEAEFPGDSETSGMFTLRSAPMIAVAMKDAALSASLIEILRGLPHIVGSADVVRTAGVVVTDIQNENIDATVREVRKTTRADAAILVVVPRSTPADVARARGAGAFGCLRAPFNADEVEEIIAGASQNHAAQTRIADLTRKLDLQSHLATMGRFTAGLHHELKNPLAVIEMNVNLLREDVELLLESRNELRQLVFSPPTERMRREQTARTFLTKTENRITDLMPALDDTRGALQRMRILFQRLQSFASRGAQPVEPVEVATVVAEVRNNAAETLEGIDVELVAEGTLKAMASRPLLEEILANLTSNAAWAARSLSAPRVRFHVYEEGERVVVSVRDNGPGIKPEDQERIFDPFYTTRRHSGGIGLGLSICREYAAQMEAQISLWSVPGRGACFRLAMRRA